MCPFYPTLLYVEESTNLRRTETFVSFITGKRAGQAARESIIRCCTLYLKSIFYYEVKIIPPGIHLSHAW